MFPFWYSSPGLLVSSSGIIQQQHNNASSFWNNLGRKTLGTLSSFTHCLQRASRNCMKLIDTSIHSDTHTRKSLDRIIAPLVSSVSIRRGTWRKGPRSHTVHRSFVRKIVRFEVQRTLPYCGQVFVAMEDVGR